jgi:hypothetical protein
MEHSQEHETHRFARDVSALAPKPGHLLGTVGFSYRGTSYSLAIIEGAPNDTASIIGISTDFTSLTSVRFGLEGDIMGKLHDLPSDPRALGMTLEFSGAYSPFGDDYAQVAFPIQSAKVVFTRIRAANGIDPDGAIVRLKLTSNEEIIADLAGFKRGWEIGCWIVIVVIAVAASGCTDSSQKKKKEVVVEESDLGVDVLNPEVGKVHLEGKSKTTTTTEYGDPDKR